MKMKSILAGMLLFCFSLIASATDSISGTITKVYPDGSFQITAAPPIVLVNHTKTTNSVSPAIDTTGANFLVMMTVDYITDPTVLKPVDSYGNVWVHLTSQYENQQGVAGMIWYVKNPVVGSGHTFTVTGALGVGVAVAAFSGVDTISPFDVENGAHIYGYGLNSLQSGPVTPVAGELVITGFGSNAGQGVTYTVDSGFTITDYAVQDIAGVGKNEGFGLAYLVQSAAGGSVNPKWSVSGTVGFGSYLSTIASFKVSSGPPPPPVCVTPSVLDPVNNVCTCPAPNTTVNGVCTAPPPTATYDLTVSQAAIQLGNITTLDGFINCGQICKHTYNAGTVVQLTATPSTGGGAVFSGWSGDCTGTGTCSLTMDAPHNATATFSVPAPVISCTQTGSGITCACAASNIAVTPTTVTLICQ